MVTLQTNNSRTILELSHSSQLLNPSQLIYKYGISQINSSRWPLYAMYTLIVSFVACNYETRQAQPLRSYLRQVN